MVLSSEPPVNVELDASEVGGLRCSGYLAGSCALFCEEVGAVSGELVSSLPLNHDLRLRQLSSWLKMRQIQDAIESSWSREVT